MSVKFYFIIIITLFCNNSYAQFGEQQIISTQAAAPRSVFSADIDGDGDLDVISASEGDGKVAWYKNLDGLGNFGQEQIIMTNIIGALNVIAADVDGDNDMDVLVASKGSSTADWAILWSENINGLGNFDNQIVIDDLTDGANSVFTSDLDGDGDLDVLSSSYSDNKIAWYKNLDGLGDFSDQIIISNTVYSASGVTSGDMDNDGDMDVIATSGSSHEILWFENTDGLGSFSQHYVSTFIGSPRGVYAIDIDLDEDLDILSTGISFNEVIWFENLDGLGNFGPQNMITTTDNNEYISYPADVDNDGDIDVISAAQISGFDNEILWYENIDGLGEFSEHQVITYTSSFAWDLNMGDLNNDGDLDLIIALDSQTQDKIAWYENLTILGTEEESVSELALYPNPVKSTLQINSYNIVINNIAIYTIFGERVLNKKGNDTQIDLSNLSTGLYLVKIQTENGELIKKVIKE